MNEEQIQPNNIQNPLPPNFAISRPKIPRKAPWLVLGIVGIFVIGAFATGVGFLYSQVWDPLWNPFRPLPSVVIKQMLEKSAMVKQAHTEMRLSVLSKNKESDAGNEVLSLGWAGTADASDSQNGRGTGTLTLTIAPPGQEMLNLAVEIRTIGERSYMQVTTLNLPSFVELESIGIRPDQIQGRWMKIDQETVKAIQEQEGVSAFTNNGQEALFNKIRDLFNNTTLYRVDKSLPDEIINGEKTYHYAILVDKQALSKLASEVLKTIFQSSAQDLSGTQSGIDLQFPAEAIVTQMVNGFLNNLGDIKGEVWIGIKDKLLYKLTGGTELDISKIQNSAQGIFAARLSMDFSRYNQPVMVIEPVNYIKLEALLANVFAQQKLATADTKTRESMSSLRSGIDFIYNREKTYLGATCRTKSLTTLCNSIKQESGSFPVVRVARKSYCAYVILQTKANGKSRYYCFDSTFGQGTTTINPQGNGYCTGRTFICPKPEGF